MTQVVVQVVGGLVVLLGSVVAAWLAMHNASVCAEMATACKYDALRRREDYEQMRRETAELERELGIKHDE